VALAKNAIYKYTGYDFNEIKDCVQFFFGISGFKREANGKLEGEYCDGLRNETCPNYEELMEKGNNAAIQLKFAIMRFYYQPYYSDLKDYLDKGTPGMI
jgi:hypothetical protein